MTGKLNWYIRRSNFNCCTLGPQTGLTKLFEMDVMMETLLTDLETTVDPAHTAVLVVDIQNDFCATGGHTETNLKKSVADCQSVVEPIQALVAETRAAGASVIWIKADYDRRYLSPPIHARQLSRGISDAYCVAGTWGAEFYQVSPVDGDTIIEKHRHSAFIGTGLDQVLRDREIKTLIMAGVQTHVCVESTLRDASARGYYIVVAGDCVASFDRDLHEKTLRCVEMHFGEVVNSAEIVKLWKG
ncbi:MAG: isochorismatase family cysteine hydrolase [Pseudomonadota bacterium]|nr:isochorismatase family cysteine hydrolase [Pseudomonadota bacterium]